MIGFEVVLTHPAMKRQMAEALEPVIASIAFLLSYALKFARMALPSASRYVSSLSMVSLYNPPCVPQSCYCDELPPQHLLRAQQFTSGTNHGPGVRVPTSSMQAGNSNSNRDGNSDALGRSLGPGPQAPPQQGPKFRNTVQSSSIICCRTMYT